MFIYFICNLKSSVLEHINLEAHTHYYNIGMVHIYICTVYTDILQLYGELFFTEMWKLALLSTDMSILGILLKQECPRKKGLKIFQRIEDR